MNFQVIRLLIACVSFAAFIWWAGGNRTLRITFGSMWFLLTRPAILLVAAPASLAMGYLMWNGAVAQGNDPMSSLALMVGISVLCGFGAAALVVPPLWMLSRARATKLELELPHGETVRHEWKVNHFLGLESRGGHAYLTDTALYFVPHRFAVQTAPWSIELGGSESIEVGGGRLLVLHERGEKEHWIVAAQPEEIGKSLEALPAFGSST